MELSRLGTEEKIKIAQKIVSVTCPVKYKNHSDYFSIRLTPQEIVTVTIADDHVVDDMPEIKIRFTDSKPIKLLTIIVESGKYYDEDETIGGEYFGSYCGVDTNITFSCNNTIEKIIVVQKVLTTELYSDRYDDGFLAQTIALDYDTNRYKDIQFCGNFDIRSSADGFKLKLKENTFAV